MNLPTEVALFFQYAGIVSVAILVLLCVLVLMFNRIDWPFDPDPEEVARRQAEAAAKKATKEFKRRQRLKAVRFFNF